ncbi:MAG: FixH family protein [Xanthobacteraceae bacterium]|nr:FixH family protein [Xanthobacteraceae bacterium]
MAPASSRPLTGRRVLVYLLAFFGIVFAANGVLIKVALDTMPGLEVESAYRASLAFNREARAAEAQAARGWRVEAHVERDPAGRATIRVEARDRAGAPLAGLAFSARLARPADKRLDREIALAERESGIYRGTLEDVALGQWDLVLEAERASASLFRARNRVVLR